MEIAKAEWLTGEQSNVRGRLWQLHALFLTFDLDNDKRTIVPLHFPPSPDNKCLDGAVLGEHSGLS